MVADKFKKEETTPLPVELDRVLEKQVAWLLQKMWQSLSRKVGDSVSFICGHEITFTVMEALSGSELSWIFNGDPLVMDPSRMVYDKGNLDLTDVTPRDTGVYSCMVSWGTKQAPRNVTVGLYSLEVTADSVTRYVSEGDSLFLICHSLAIGQLFSTATRQWFFNGTNVTYPEVTLASNESVDAVDKISKVMSGIWECRVRDVKTSRVWNTAWYWVGVDNAPMLVEKAYQSMVDHSYVVIVVVSCLAVVLCAGFIYAAYRMKKTEDETDEEFVDTRNGWEKTFTDYGSEGKVRVEDKDLPPKRPKKDDSDSDEQVTATKKAEKEEDTSDTEVKEEQEKKTETRTANQGKTDDKEKAENEEKNDKEEMKSDELDEEKEGDETNNDANFNFTKRGILVHQKLKRRRLRKGSVKILDVDQDYNRNISHLPTSAVDTGLPSGTRYGGAHGSAQATVRAHSQREPTRLLVYPEVQKQSAILWLLKHSAQLKGFEGDILRSARDSPLREVERLTHSRRIHGLPSSLHLRNQPGPRQAATASWFTQPDPVLTYRVRAKTNPRLQDVNESARPATGGEMGAPTGTQEGSTQVKKHACPESDVHAREPSTSDQKMTSLKKIPALGASKVKSWLARGRDGWKRRRPGGGARWSHQEVRYSVLPGDDFTEGDEDTLV